MHRPTADRPAATGLPGARSELLRVEYRGRCSLGRQPLRRRGPAPGTESVGVVDQNGLNRVISGGPAEATTLHFLVARSLKQSSCPQLSIATSKLGKQRGGSVDERNVERYAAFMGKTRQKVMVQTGLEAVGPAEPGGWAREDNDVEAGRATVRVRKGALATAEDQQCGRGNADHRSTAQAAKTLEECSIAHATPSRLPGARSVVLRRSWCRRTSVAQPCRGLQFSKCRGRSTASLTTARL